MNNLIKPGSVTYSIILFISVVMIIQFFKPACLYNHDGSFKIFGLGYRNKTIIPMWLAILILAILSYVVIFAYNQPNRLL